MALNKYIVIWLKNRKQCAKKLKHSEYDKKQTYWKHQETGTLFLSNRDSSIAKNNNSNFR